MATEELKIQIDELAKKYATLKEGLPSWDGNNKYTNQFPDFNDLRYMASKVQPLSITTPDKPYFTNIKIFVKHLYTRWIQPLLQKVFKEQMLFNEYTWLLANTVAIQNQKIAELEEKINEFKSKN
jgi:hypothetical protein